MFEKLVRWFTGKNCDLRERMFRTIIVFGGIAAIFGTIESIFVKKINNMLPYFIMLLLAMGIAMVTTFKYRKYSLAATILYFLIIVVMFPSLFFMGGGVNGAAPIWMALGILYAFLMFNKRKVWIYVTFCTSVYGLCYLLAYHFPEMVTYMESTKLLYIDSYFAVVVVGVTSGLISKSHMEVFEEEHRLNIEQKEELEQSRDSKNVFFANMSHEIRTPINTIIGLNEMIQRVAESEEIKGYSRDIQLASRLLLSQVNDILDLSQMEMQKMKLIPVKYRTEELFGELVDMVRVRMERKGLEFYVDIDQNLPAVLLGDAKRLKQIVLNLLDNALKYTDEGLVVLSATGEPCGEQEIRLKISVADSGIGIRKEDMEHIYDSFNRADEKRNLRIMGSGLGLAITKQLVDMMEGEIKVDSIYTKGSTFTVTFTQKIEEEAPMGVVNFMSRSVQEGELYHVSFEAPEARILVVDDNPMNAKVACSLLTETKVQMDIAGSGMECLKMTKQHFYHVILLDYMMPDMNGTELLTAIRRQENGLCRNSAVIALTANVVADAKELYLEQGFDSYVEKPIVGRTLELEILKQLPKELIEYEEAPSEREENIRNIQKATVKKRKKIYITTDCTCDLPEELLEKYDIKLLYLYIQTPNGRFMDTREIDSDSLKKYIAEDSTSAYPVTLTVEECEEFFAEALTQAEKVIHISLASSLGKIYGVANMAAKSFDHVKVIDSGQIACGLGMLVLHAAKLAEDGKTAEDICEELERMKENVQTRFVLPGAGIFNQAGYMRGFGVGMCKILQLHPMVVMKQGKSVPEALLGGTLEKTWKQAIRWHLRKKKKISKEVVFIVHVGCSVKQQEFLMREIRKCLPFKRVIIQKASLTNACCSGIGTVGITYYKI